MAAGGTILAVLGGAAAVVVAVSPGVQWHPDGAHLGLVRTHTVTVQVPDAPERTIVTAADTVAGVLRALGLEKLLEGDARISPAPDQPATDGLHVRVQLPVPVTIAVDGRVLDRSTYAADIAGVLAEAGVQLTTRDLVDPDLAQSVGEGTVITVRRVEVREEQTEHVIEHGERREPTADLEEGTTRVAEPGRDGRRVERYEVTLIDGEETDRVLLAEEVVRAPQDRVLLVGTAPGQIRQLQQLLTDLGYPVGPVDGVDGPQTRRGLCAWRRLEGLGASRQPLQSGELDAVRATVGLPAAAPGLGVTVDRTCQTLYLRDSGRWQEVLHVSTGADGLPREGSYRIQRTRAGWHTSTLYPAPQPNMYNSLFFHGAIAIHGARHVPPHPASAGCVRVTPEAADRLFATLGVGDPVEVIGRY